MIEGKLAIFGAGDYGRRALWEYGSDHVCCFIDNSADKQGTYIDSIPVISLNDYKALYNSFEILIANTYAYEIAKQVDENNISNYRVYMPHTQYYYPEDELIVDTYEHRTAAENEGTWNANMQNNRDIDYISACVESLSRNPELFNHIEIETYNRCNGGCSFCPVSVKNETRPEMKMDETLFKRIIDNLSELNYDGKIALFSNNEPFLDDRILDFHKYAREKLPKARFHLFTNGTKLSLDMFIKVIGYLDELIIDNYNQSLNFIPNNKAIKEYCEKHPELIKKVSIVLRKQDEILTSRGGDAPNRSELVSYENATCMLPFRQMIVRPDGKVSLCCNDPLGKFTLGDLNKERIEDVWYGDKFNVIRRKIKDGRKNIDKCKYCDVFTIA